MLLFMTYNNIKISLYYGYIMVRLSDYRKTQQTLYNILEGLYLFILICPYIIVKQVIVIPIYQ